MNTEQITRKMNAAIQRMVSAGCSDATTELSIRNGAEYNNGIAFRALLFFDVGGGDECFMTDRCDTCEQAIAQLEILVREFIALAE